MPLSVLVIGAGRVKEPFIRDGIAEYKKRLGGYARVSVEDVADESIPLKLTGQVKLKIIDTEGDRILKRIKDDDFVVLLDLEGENWDSETLASIIGEAELSTRGRIVFAIGGSLGVSGPLTERADRRWCLSPLTFPHQLTRLIVLEQVYRAFKIIRKESYHK